MNGVFVFLAMLGGVMLLIGLITFLRRDTHCMECGGRLDVPVWHCAHGVKEDLNG